MDGVEKAMFEQQQQALFRQWITSPSAGYARQNPDGTPYRDPQPTLTDEEREAICQSVTAYDGNDDDDECAKIAATLRGLLERLG